MPVDELTGRALERLRRQAERRGLTINTELAEKLPSVLVDGDRIGQVLVNLVHNAIKWTPAGGTITIRAVPALSPPDQRTARELQHVEGPGWIKISVHDTGIGIPASETDRIFERFYKVDRARTREGSGTGLGLAIAKHLVEHHGGRIWAESHEGQGSTFSMLLPVA
jgi:two-component system phosphate regulon sensor histidine kinase PhoR